MLMLEASLPILHVPDNFWDADNFLTISKTDDEKEIEITIIANDEPSTATIYIDELLKNLKKLLESEPTLSSRYKINEKTL